MPLKIDSYTTTAGSMVDTRRLATAIKEAVITDDLDTKLESKLNVQSYGDFFPLFITGTYPSEAKIPPFAHPISILNIRGKNFICTDLRLFLKKDTNMEFERRITNRIDFDYAVSRTALNLIWAGGRSSEFTSGFKFSAKVFSEWVSQTLGSGIGLELQELIPVQITALAYYYSLCQDQVLDIRDEQQRISDWICNMTDFNDTGVKKVLNLLEPMAEFNHFIENLKKVVDNIRIQKLDAGNFITLIRSSWYGVNSPQVLATCIEHPPTWTAIVHHTLASKGYQRCLIGQVALRAGKRGDADSFMRHYDEMFRQLLKLESISSPAGFAIDHDFDYDGLELAMEAEGRLPLL